MSSEKQLQLPLPGMQTDLNFDPAADDWSEPPDPVLSDVMYLAALEFAAHGFHVLPLSVNESTPCIKGWEKLASTNPETILGWWREFPKANIGIATGHKVVVTDIDPRNGGLESLAELEAEHGKFEPTLVVRTPGGGYHYYSLNPPNIRIRNSTSAVRPGIDIKGYHGYVVAPPSVRTRTGKCYSFELPEGVAWYDVLIPPMALWLRSAAGKAKSLGTAEAKKYRNLKPGEVVPEGSRHEAMLAYAVGLRKMGDDAVGIYPKLMKWADEHCPGHDPMHAFQMSESMMNYDTLEETAEAKKERANAIVDSTVEDSAPDPDYLDSLDKGEKGGIFQTIANVCTILSRAPSWWRGFQYNRFLERDIIRRDLSQRLLEGLPLNDKLVLDVRHLINITTGVDFGTKLVLDGIVTVAGANAIHPVVDYLESLTWDGKARVAHWLSVYLGVERNDYTSAAGQVWLISACARVMQPGCVIDSTLVLEGRQGLGKNDAMAALLPNQEWKGTLGGDLMARDTVGKFRGKWFVELSEMSHARKSEVDELKSFLTETVDDYRSAYGHLEQQHPRQCVFFGTTNNETYLKDDTGGRRFLPVKCNAVVSTNEGDFLDRDGLRRDRDQLWAEAFHLYSNGASWKLSGLMKAVAGVQQELRMLEDPWEDPLVAFLGDRVQITMAEVLDALGKPLGQSSPFDVKRAGAILRKLGWVNGRYRAEGKKLRCWVLEEGKK